MSCNTKSKVSRGLCHQYLNLHLSTSREGVCSLPPFTLALKHDCEQQIGPFHRAARYESKWIHHQQVNHKCATKWVLLLQMIVFFYNGQVADIPFTLLQGKIEVSFNVFFIDCSSTALKTEPMWKVTTDSQNKYPLLAPASLLAKQLRMVLAHTSLKMMIVL